MKIKREKNRRIKHLSKLTDLVNRTITGLLLLSLFSVSHAQTEVSGSQTDNVTVMSGNELSNTIFNMLSADLSDRIGDKNNAMDSLLKASIISDDWQVAQQASYYALRNQKFDKAQEAALRWLQLVPVPPESAKARVVLGLSYIGKGDMDTAVSQIQLAVSETRHDELLLQDIYQRFASELFYLQNRDAFNTYDYMLSEIEGIGIPVTSSAYTARALMSYRLNNRRQYVQSLKAAVMLDKHNIEAGTMLMEFYFESGEENTEEVTNFARQFLAENDNVDKARLAYARYLYLYKRLEESKNQVEMLLDSNDIEVRAPAIFMSSIMAYQKGQYKLTKLKLNNYIKIIPDNDRVWFVMCDTEFKLNNFAQALDACGRIEGDDYYFRAQMMMVDILITDNQYEQAIRHLSDLILEDNQRRDFVILKKFNLIMENGEYARAKQVLDEAIAFDPNNIELLYSRGLWLSEHGEIQAMEDDFRKIISLNANYAQAYNAWGYSLTERTQEYNRALDLILKANQLLPDNPFILDSLGWVYFKKGNLDKAEFFLERAYDISKDNEITLHLIEVYKALGKNRKAKSLLTNLKQEAGGALQVNNENQDLGQGMEVMSDEF